MLVLLASLRGFFLYGGLTLILWLLRFDYSLTAIWSSATSGTSIEQVFFIYLLLGFPLFVLFEVIAELIAVFYYKNYYVVQDVLLDLSKQVVLPVYAIVRFVVFVTGHYSREPLTVKVRCVTDLIAAICWVAMLILGLIFCR